MKALLPVLQKQSEPVTAAQVAKLVGEKASAVTAALNELAQSGKAFAFTQGKGTAYTAKDPLDLCATALASAVAALKAPTAPEKLAAAIPKTLRPWFDDALSRLIVQGKAYWISLGKTMLVLNRSVKPSDLVDAPQVSAVQNILAEANRHRRKPRTIDQFKAWLDGDA